MLTRDQIVQILRQEQAYLAAEFGVSRMGLFGSYAKGQADQASDIDLLVEFERPIGFRFLELADYLERVLGRKVDVLTPAGIQNIRIHKVAQNISQSIVYV
jgi:predicted nucleotidyltransferase